MKDIVNKINKILEDGKELTSELKSELRKKKDILIKDKTVKK